jgi:dipeptidase E
MKRLFLTSSAWITLPKIIPYLSDIPSRLSVAFIPTAANLYDKKPWIDDDRKKLTEMGFSVFDFDLEGKNESEVREFLKDKDLLFVAGGNTFYLLEWSQKSGFGVVVKELVDKGKPYIGSSAGSVIAGPDIESVGTFDDPQEAQLSSTKGFGMVDFVILPHYKKDKNSVRYVTVMHKYGGIYQFMPVSDNQAVFVMNGRVEIVEVV